MKCIFCGQDSSRSVSVEHIIPESFGNSTAILPKGIVCDKCNNYFARKIEGPFLNSEVVRKLRQELEIENKDGKLIKSFTYPRVGKEYVKQVSSDQYLIYCETERSDGELETLVAEYQNYHKVSDDLLLIPNDITARFLGKMAIEAFVHNCKCSLEVSDYVLNDPAFKPMREYVRLGNRKMWEYNARRIYARNEAYKGDPFSSINWEFDFLILGNGEIYFIIVLYGIEYAINILVPSINGYKDWLSDNDYQSPLYINPDALEKELTQYIETMYTDEEKKELQTLRRKQKDGTLFASNKQHKK